MVMFTIGILGLITVLDGSRNALADTDSRTRAQAIATREIEALRAIEYEALGHPDGSVLDAVPVGSFPLGAVDDIGLSSDDGVIHDESVVFDGQEFGVRRWVMWDTVSTASEGSGEDYKRVIVEVSWETRGQARSIVNDSGVYAFVDQSAGIPLGTLFSPHRAESLSAQPYVDSSGQPFVQIRWETPAAIQHVPGTWRIRRSQVPFNGSTSTVIVSDLSVTDQPSTEIVYVDSNPPIGTAMVYEIVGFNLDGDSSPAVFVTATADTGAPVSTTSTSTSTTSTTTPGSTSTTTSTTAPSGCTVNPQPANPQAVGVHASKLIEDVYLEVITSGTCTALHFEVETKSNETQVGSFAQVAPGLWSYTIQSQHWQWSKGDHDIFVNDSTGGTVAVIALTVFNS